MSSDLSDSDEADSSEREQGSSAACSETEEFCHKEQFIESGIFEELGSAEQGTQTGEAGQGSLNQEIGKLSQVRHSV